jgi:segregation and condensation protein A
MDQLGPYVADSVSDDRQLDLVDASGSGDESSELKVLESESYAVHLAAYDGPFDLLLTLIRSKEIDIFDIPIAELTAAYLGTLKSMKRQGIELASEFLLMAATLIQLKSRMLLPRQTQEDDSEEVDLDPRAALVRQLLEYQAFKEVALALDENPRIGRDVFNRPTGQDKPPDEREQELPPVEIYQLARAFRSLMKRQRYQAPHEIYVERITIGERIAQIADRLASQTRVSFASLCLENYTREEVITTFLALLEMARLKLISVTQRNSGTPVYVEARVDGIDVRGEKAAGMLAE